VIVMANPEPSPDDLAATPSRMTKVAVYTALVVAVLLGLGLIVATGVRWLTQRTPSSIVVIHGGPSLAAGTLVITPETGPARAPIPMPHDGDYSLPVFLDTGAYAFTVKVGGAVVFHDSLYIADGSRYDVDIRPAITTQP
jgi:hypothetical protein